MNFMDISSWQTNIDLPAQFSEDSQLDGVDYAQGTRVCEDTELFKCRQPHTSQADLRPSVTPALWQKVEKPGQGDTPGDPIPWSWGLEIITGKYYSQFDVIYRGIRDSGAGIFADLASLVGNYVEVTE